MIFYILFLKHTICHRFRIQKDMFHILLPKQISSLGTGSGPVPTSPPPLFGTRFWQETNRKIAPEELCRGKFPYNRARFGGSPRTNSILLYSRSRRQRNSASGRRRGLPFRPYLHARISRITVVEQLPQMMIIIRVSDYGDYDNHNDYENYCNYDSMRFDPSYINT